MESLDWEEEGDWKTVDPTKEGRSPIMSLTSLYYRCKRLIPRRLRLALRQAHAAHIMRACGDTWPIQESAGSMPDGWPGWPAGRQFALLLTHDVESKRGLERVKQMAELEMELGFRSSFNFVPEGEYRVTADLRDWLTTNGFEIGVHDLHHDGSLYSSRSGFGKKAQKINQYLKEWNAVGFRSGFMFHNLNWAHELELLYEASTFDTDPFEPQPDGANTIFPFWVPRPTAVKGMQNRCNRRTGYVELPYTLPQDSTLFILLRQTTIDIWKRKLKWIAGKGGMALVNVHPDYASFGNEVTVPGEFPVRHYREFLSHIVNQYSGVYWHALPQVVAELCANLFQDGTSHLSAEDVEMASTRDQ